ncbi:MAG: hypothetical protein WC475_04915 [Candidatus Paceibacterota bacterium]
MMNKKGVEINVTTVIIVILAVLVLVVLSLFFTGGMTPLLDKIRHAGAAWDTTSIEQAKTACAMYCATESEDSFCNHDFDIGKNKDGTSILEKCTGDHVKAYNLDDCKNVGFTKDTCTSAE